MAMETTCSKIGKSATHSLCLQLGHLVMSGNNCFLFVTLVKTFMWLHYHSTKAVEVFVALLITP